MDHADDRSAGPPPAHSHGEITAVELGPFRVAWTPVLIGLAFAALAAFVSGSFLLHARDLHLPACSEPSDAAIYPWNFLWTKAALGAPDGSFLFTRRFYWPAGEGLGLYTPTWIYGILSLPLQWLSSDPAIRNVAVALLLWFSSFATALLGYRLARELGLARTGALLVALLATVASGRLMNAARLNLFCTEFLLLYAWLGVRLLHRGGFGRAALFGLAACLLLLQSQPLLFQAFLATACFVVAALVRRQSRRELLARWRELAVAVALFLALSAPFLWEIAQELATTPAFAQSAAHAQQGSLDLVDLFWPNRADRFFGALAAARPPSFFEEGGPLGTVSHFLGLGWIALVVVALARHDTRRAAAPAAWCALVLLLLALGPVLHAGGRPLPLPMPYRLLSLFPPLTLDKSPERLVWLVQLALALVAARAFAALAARGGGARLLAFALAAATLFEQGETLPLRSIEPRLRIPDEVAALANEPDSFAVLDLPYDGLPADGGHLSHQVDAFAMALGSFHERPIFFGVYPRAARRDEAALAARQLFIEIHRIERLAAAAAAAGATSAPPLPPLEAATVDAIRRDLAELSIGAVQLHDLRAAFPGTPRAIQLEVDLLGEFLRRLDPRRRFDLSPGKGYSLRLFRF